MSENAPAIPLFTDAYLADTRHLSLEEHGAYLQLMMIAWRSPACALPDNDKMIARMLGITAGRWAKLKPVVLSFWTLGPDGWKQKRLSKERAFVEKKREQNSRAIKSRWDKQRVENKGNDGYECRNECNTPPPPPNKAAKAASASAGKDDGRISEAGEKVDASSLLIPLCKAAGLVPPDPSNNWAKHADCIALIGSWLETGADPDTITKTLTARAGAVRKAVHSLRYFDGAVREIAQVRAEVVSQSTTLADRILKRKAAA